MLSGINKVYYYQQARQRKKKRRKLHPYLTYLISSKVVPRVKRTPHKKKLGRDIAAERPFEPRADSHDHTITC